MTDEPTTTPSLPVLTTNEGVDFAAALVAVHKMMSEVRKVVPEGGKEVFEDGMAELGRRIDQLLLSLEQKLNIEPS